MIKKLGRGIFCCLFILSCFFFSSCSAPSDTQSAGQTQAGSSVSVVAGTFSPGQLEAHYLKHGYQFGNISQEQYLEAAQQLLNAPVGGDIFGKTRPNGDILRYRSSTGEFAVMDANGRIRTYFKADYRYWMRQ